MTRWARPALAALLAATAALYLWDLSVNGYGNDFYAAAAQAGSQSWSAWFFGSLDPHNVVTVDKPPAALWVTALSVRLFGMNPWAVQAPQALMGVAAVGFLYAAVRRAVPDPREGAASGLLAGAVLALTPAAVLVFRYNNPDALLVLLTVLAAYFLTRAVATASWRWLALVGVALGVAFLTKMLEGLLVLPPMALAYLMFAPTSWLRRIAHLLIAASALIASSAWWVLAVQLWPADARPYISNSTDNSVLQLALGYNGIDRITGSTVHQNQLAGFARLFTAEVGNEISWLLPVALIGLVYGCCLWPQLRRSERAALVMWGGSLLLCATVFSVMDGMSHAYYTSAMAPAVGALIGLGSIWAVRRSPAWDGRIALAIMVAAGAAWSARLLARAQLGPAALWWLIAAAAVLAAVIVVASPTRRNLMRLGTSVGVIAAFAGTTVFAVATAATPHSGSLPNAVHTATVWPTIRGRFNTVGLLQAGGLQYNSALATALRATHTEWAAATSGSQAASALEVASGTAVMAVGGWRHDPVPTLAQFVAEVRAGNIGYYVDGGRLHDASPAARDILAWVTHNYQPSNIGGARVYRLI